MTHDDIWQVRFRQATRRIQELEGEVARLKEVASTSTLSYATRECLADVIIHYDSIVAGFAAQRLNAREAGDSDNATYWTHEMNAAYRMKVQAERALAAIAPTLSAERPCTCHPDDKLPKPCPQKYSYSECVASQPQAAEPKGMTDEQLCAVQCAEEALRAIAERRYQIGDTIEPINDIRAAASVAAAALKRFAPVARALLSNGE